MIRCKLVTAYTREEIGGTFQFDVLPREGELIRTGDNRRFKVSDVEHVLRLTEPNLNTHEIVLGVWKV
jgi:hypothetical protein